MREEEENRRAFPQGNKNSLPDRYDVKEAHIRLGREGRKSESAPAIQGSRVRRGERSAAEYGTSLTEGI